MSSFLYTPTHKRFDDWGKVTPQVEISEGIRPAQAYLPAPYLPTVRYNEHYRDYFVISAGTPVALDSNGFVIPAGLALQFQNITKSTGVNLATTAGLTTYSATDVTLGIKNALGETCEAGEPVIAAMLGISNAGGEDWTSEDTRLDDDTNVVLALTPAIGFATADMWLLSSYGSWSPSAATLAGAAAEALAFYAAESSPYLMKYHNYELQGPVGITTRAYIEVPVVTVASAFTTADTPLFGGIARGAAITGGTIWHGNIFFPGVSVGYDVYSRYVPTLAATVSTEVSGSAITAANFIDVANSAGTTDEEVETALMQYHAGLSTICGRCLWYEPLSVYPKDYLGHVRTAYNVTGFNAIDRMPGSANGGYPDNVAYAASSATISSSIVGVARINLVFNAH